MTRVIIICALGLVSCATAQQAMPLLAQVTELIGKFVELETGRDVEEMRSECIMDPVGSNGKITILCEFWPTEEK